MTTRRGNYEAHSSEAACGKRPFECEYECEKGFYAGSRHKEAGPKESSQANDSIQSLIDESNSDFLLQSQDRLTPKEPGNQTVISLYQGQKSQAQLYVDQMLQLGMKASDLLASSGVFGCLIKVCGSHQKS
ncbi:unnamed protein product [Boreogadus saida]